MASAKTYDPDELRAILTHASANQRRHIEAVIQHGSARKAALASGCNKGAVVAAIDRARRASELAITRTELDTSGAYATTTLYRDPTPDSDTPLQWVKRKKSAEDQMAAMEIRAKALAEGMEPLPNVRRKSKETEGKLMTCYPIADAHIGMLSWHEETGEDYDITIAERVHRQGMKSLVDRSPPSKYGVIIDLGDLTHSDNVAGVTERSNNSLAMDGRFAKMIRISNRVMLQAINSALEKHEIVIVKIVPGNHNDTNAMQMREWLPIIYADNPRVRIEGDQSVFGYIRHGKCLIGIHHGHTTKPADLPGVMACDRAKDWGDTEYRAWWTGHIHHLTRKEAPGVTVESFRTMAAKDDYAHSHGYRSAREMVSITLHEDFGEDTRTTASLRRAEAEAMAGK